MKSLIMLFIGLLSLSALAETELIAQCAVNEVTPRGVRVNLRQNSNGSFKGNLIFGTTVSGTTYQLKEVSTGVYTGSIKGKPQFTMKLIIGTKAASNKNVVGYASSLEAIYPTVLNEEGFKSLKTKSSDKFVCGKVIGRF